jgi:hypothetical protein
MIAQAISAGIAAALLGTLLVAGSLFKRKVRKKFRRKRRR